MVARILAALALALLLATPAMAAHTQQHRTVCVTYHDPSAGPVRICGVAIRPR